jgi:O-acetyl-ADP-ribose deacetylase (regulator of RNase III)
MRIRYIGAIIIGLLFSSFYQSPVLANGELESDMAITALQDRNNSAPKNASLTTKNKIIKAILLLVAAGAISWIVYKTFIQKPNPAIFDPVVIPANVIPVIFDPVVIPANGLLAHDITINFVIGDITQQDFEYPEQAAIVNAANELMLGGAGIDGAIHRAAGPGLRAECYRVAQVQPGVRCPTGEARITGGHNLAPARIIHTVGPNIQRKIAPDAHDAQLLENVYRNVLQVATENDLREIAIPSVSTGIFRYPLDEATNIAANAVQGFVAGSKTNLEEIRFVLSDQVIAQAYREAFSR